MDDKKKGGSTGAALFNSRISGRLTRLARKQPIPRLCKCFFAGVVRAAVGGFVHVLRDIVGHIGSLSKDMCAFLTSIWLQHAPLTNETFQSFS